MHSAWSVWMPAIGWALLHFLWQGLLIGWGTALALNLLRKARPQTRYAVACGALLLCAALPLAGVVAGVAATGDAGRSVMAPIVHLAGAGDVAVGPALIGRGAIAGWESALRAQLGWVVVLWCCGAGVMCLRLAIGLKWVAERTAAGRYQTNPYWQRRLSLLARRFDIGRPVRFGVAQLLDSPITAGCWRPIVLVPASLVSGMPPDLLEALLAHELAHIQRHDYLVNLIQSAIEIVLFYHPSVWALSRRIRVEREQIADDIAVKTLGQPQRLARALSELDRFQFDTTQLAHAAHGGNLMSRIKRLLRPDVEPISWKMALPLIGLCAASAVLYVQAAPAPAVVPAAAAAAAIVAASTPPVSPVAPVAPPAAAVKAAPRAITAIPAVAAVPVQPALPAAAAEPAVAPPEVRTPRHQRMGRDDGDAYALVRAGKEGMTIAGTSGDAASVDKLRHSVQGDFLWYRDGAKSYLLQDPSVLSKVSEAWKPVEHIGVQMDEQGKKMDAQGKVMDALGKQMEVLGQDAQNGPAMREMERLGREMEKLARRHEEIDLQLERALGHESSEESRRASRELAAQLRAKQEPVKRQMAELGAQMRQQGAKIRPDRELMQALSSKMREAGKPMSELGRQMGVLAGEQSKASRAAEQLTRSLVQDAIKSGKAVPAPVL